MRPEGAALFAQTLFLKVLIKLFQKFAGVGGAHKNAVSF